MVGSVFTARTKASVSAVSVNYAPKPLTCSRNLLSTGDCNESIITVLLAQIAITALSMYDLKRILEHIWCLVFVQILIPRMAESREFTFEQRKQFS